VALMGLSWISPEKFAAPARATGDAPKRRAGREQKIPDRFAGHQSASGQNEFQNAGGNHSRQGRAEKAPAGGRRSQTAGRVNRERAATINTSAQPKLKS